MAKVEIATRSFQTQTEAKKFFQEMLRRYPPGKRVNDTDALELLALIERHPDFSQKVGVGIDHFEVSKTPQGTNCFYLVRRDGRGTDFSFYSCVTGKAPTRKQEVSEAFRKAITPTIWTRRDKFFKDNASADGLFVCAKTKQRISRAEGHIDHLPPMTFEVIVTSFLGGEDNQTSAVITDPDLAQQFRDYHDSIATLGFVKADVNLSQAASNRIKKGHM